MNDQQIRRAIEGLVAEEHRLWEAQAAGEHSAAARRKLAELKVNLDSWWDLLRQRQARRTNWLNADIASDREGLGG